MNDDEREKRKEQLREVAARLERGEIEPMEAMQEVLGVLNVMDTWQIGNVVDVTLGIRASLYAIGRDDIGDSLLSVRMNVLPGRGVGCKFSVKKDAVWQPKEDDLGKLMSPEQVSDNSDAEALSQAIFLTMRAMDIPIKLDDDGNMTFDEMAGMMSIPLANDLDTAAEEFRKAMDVALGPDYKKPQGPTMEKWG